MPAILFFAAEHLYGVLVTSNFGTVPQGLNGKNMCFSYRKRQASITGLHKKQVRLV